MLSLPTLPIDRPTVVACPRCHGSGRDWRDRVCGDCKGAGIARCSTCKATSVRVVETDGYHACAGCIGRLAWECDDCGYDVEAREAEVDGEPTLQCACGALVGHILCRGCERPIAKGEVEHDDVGVWCRECAATAGDCCLCVATGIGAHEGVGCSGCGGAGEIKAPRWREEE